MRLLPLLAVGLLLAAPAQAAGPRVRLILAPGLSADALFLEFNQPRWRLLRERAATAALNVNVAGPSTTAASRHSLLLGRRADSRRLPANPDGVVLRELADLGVPVAFGEPDRTAALTVEDLPAGAPSAALAVAARAAPDELLLLTSPDPGEPVRNSRTLLAPLLVVGPGWGGQWATSATTRTPGLAANVDLLPTVLAHLRLERPGDLEGRPLRPAAPGGRWGPAALARHAAATHRLMTPGLLAWGGLAFLAALGALAAARAGGGAARPARAGLALALAVAPAMLLAAAWPAASAAALAGRIAALAVLLAALALLPGRPRSPALRLLAALTALCLADLFLDLGMLPRNLMSDFPNVGARFYGIGNEWEGLLLAATLLLPFAAPADGAGTPSPGTWAGAAVLWAATLAAVGLPMFGADLGGALTFVLAYGLAAAVFAVPGADRRRLARRLGGALAGAGLVVAALVALDLARPPETRTHVGRFAAQALGGEWGPVLALVGRKLALNLEMARSGYFLLGLIAALPVVALCRRLLARSDLGLSSAPAFAAGLRAVLAGGVIGLVLNDTGVVTWGLCTGVAVVALLDQALAAAAAGEAGAEPAGPGLPASG